MGTRLSPHPWTVGYEDARGRAFWSLLDERAFETQHLPLKLGVYAKSPAFCEELDGCSEDVQIRERA
eukprot:4674990-Heterocapsa_arctica.AAC.1